MNKVLDAATMFKKNCLMMKIYFERAYDCASCNFLRYLFKCLKFGVK